MGLVCALIVLCLLGHVTCDTWGSNVTRTIKGSRYYLENAPFGHGTYAFFSEPIVGEPFYSAFMYNASTQSNVLILVGINFDATVSASIEFGRPEGVTPPSLIGATGLNTFTGPFTLGGVNRTVYNIGIFGGQQRNGVTLASSYKYGIYQNGNQLQPLTQSNAYGTFPAYAHRGFSASVDQSVTLKFNAGLGTASVPIYLFGGLSNPLATNATVSADMIRSVSDNAGGIASWEEVPAINAGPEARYDHKSISINDTMYLFGGRDENGAFGDTWMFHFPTLNWTKLHDFGYVAIEDAGETNSTTTPVGSLAPYSPPSRYGHSLIVISDTESQLIDEMTQLIILAGGTNGNHTFNDLWGFDPKTLAWAELDLPIKYPARANAALFRNPGSSTTVYMYGGDLTNGTDYKQYGDIWLFDLSTPSGPSPSFKRTPNAIIAGVAGGILLFLIIMVIVLKITGSNNN